MRKRLWPYDRNKTGKLYLLIRLRLRYYCLIADTMAGFAGFCKRLSESTYKINSFIHSYGSLFISKKWDLDRRYGITDPLEIKRFLHE